MHIHGYAWLGEKKAFDEESLRRPVGEPPTADSPLDVIQRYRSALADFPVTDLPPLQTAHWLLKPASLVRGTWQEPKEAGEWLGLQLSEFAPRFVSEDDREVTRLMLLTKGAVERLAWGGDVSFGHYLKGTVFHSIALVTCSPNRTDSTLPCPIRQTRT
ncbi:hypothetical protein SNS2_3437 [Streptomyces netropsis]|uniref:Uncharacterized protein n=1 Tax=Streptomyces syringium TaxID=76729 RepID=A0ABS4Y7P8_9ACTN|nr:hypothetical protein [Streptomyces syringium]MBP2404814.1 hypothetical protein [Streptomyces syringium]SPE57783.1 hypothetical protein SNS2_3437 [Streptomyces netropsis]